MDEYVLLEGVQDDGEGGSVARQVTPTPQHQLLQQWAVLNIIVVYHCQN